MSKNEHIAPVVEVLGQPQRIHRRPSSSPASTIDLPTQAEDPQSTLHEEKVSPPMSFSPTVTVYGFGGFGLATLRRIRANIEGLASVVSMDTAEADATVSDGTLVIGSGEGAGKDRRKQSTAVQAKLTSMSDEELGISDINILMFSLSGGSGSVIGPLMQRELLRRGVLPVIVCLAETTTSEIDAKNTLATLASMSEFCKPTEKNKDGAFVPTMFFQNSPNTRRHQVDASVNFSVETLVRLLVLPTVSIDRSDRSNFVNPARVVGVGHGLRQLHVGTAVPPEVSPDHNSQTPYIGELWNPEGSRIYESVLSLGVTGAEGDVFADHNFRARWFKEGTIADGGRAMPIIGYTANQGDMATVIAKDVQKTKDAFGAESRSTAVVFGDGAQTDNDTGLIF